MGKAIRYIIPLCAAFGLALPGISSDKLTLLPSNEARRENMQVNKRIQWHSNLDEARQEAAATGRLVFWVHMLGSMDGKT